MYRLTYKEKWIDEFVNEEHQYKTKDNYSIDKLGKLEDLEEELGCPLEVVFKALKEGVKVNMEFLDIDITDDILRPRLYYSDDFQCYGLSIQSWGYFVKLKDYQKTWWIKGDKEND